MICLFEVNDSPLNKYLCLLKTTSAESTQVFQRKQHTLVHLWILLSARGGTLGKCSYWEGLAYE